MDAMTKLSELYTTYREKGKNNKVVLEMEKLDDELSTTYAAARQYIDAQKESSSDTSEIFSVDLLNQMNISDQSETYSKDGHNVSQEVGTVDAFNNVRNSVPLKSIENQTNTTTECQKNYSVYETEKSKNMLRTCRCRMNIKSVKSCIAP